MKEKQKNTKLSFKALWVFYLLIAFEIIYMISPFGIYYYSVYGKGLNYLNDNSITTWLSSFFLPHIADTSALGLNVMKYIGGCFACIGLLSFFVGAIHVYYYRFRRKGAVRGGLYHFIRHPQYVSLAICSFGLLLIWPRYLVLIMFITMLFAYYFLAKVEERECENKFGQPYIDYKKRANMFLPFSIPFIEKIKILPKSGIKRYAVILTIYVFVILFALNIAKSLKDYSIEKIYKVYSVDSATISLVSIDHNKFDKVLEIALSDPEVQNRLNNAKKGLKTKFLNYLLPSEWYFADIPMDKPEEKVFDHHQPKNYNGYSYKIIFNRVKLRTNKDVYEDQIILNTIKRYPVAEVEIDLLQNKVVGIKNPPANVYWGDIPMPLF